MRMHVLVLTAGLACVCTLHAIRLLSFLLCVNVSCVIFYTVNISTCLPGAQASPCGSQGGGAALQQVPRR